MNHWMRQIHRWLSIVFTVTVVANFAYYGTGGTPPAAVTYAPLAPLLFMTITGLYMFALPYVAKWRSGQRST
jgi:hypothetical protein